MGADLSQDGAASARPAAGLGKLVGKQPNGERERPLELASHAVNVRVMGNVATTEVHEAFHNPTGETLEGLYRFPLPADAQIAGLSLKVGDRWMDGEFMETARAERIFRDVIDRWLDPALLKWKQGNQFELRIFPILPNQTREIKISYVQTLKRNATGYRYAYPMPVDVAGQIPAAKFSFDAKLYGVDAASEVAAEGYDATIERGATERDVTLATVHYDATNFWASGDLSVRFARPNDNGVNVTTYDETVRVGEPSYAVVSIVPDLSQRPTIATRDFVLVADTSYSRRGALTDIQTELLSRIVAEMDPQDRVIALACATSCRPVGGGSLAPATPERARDIATGFAAIKPSGTFSPIEAARVAERILNARPAADQARQAHLVLSTDGAASSGAVNPSTLRAAMNATLGPKDIRTSIINLGGDTDEANLNALATAVGAMLVDVDPGRSSSETALDILRRHYAEFLSDITVEWPNGVTQATRPSVQSLSAGDELTVAARFGGPVSGDLIVRGVRGGQPFQQRVPLSLMPSRSPSAAFAPRKWAAMTMADLDLEGDSRRAEIINLSVRYGVLSRYTALLALEDEQMMRDYGVRKHTRADLPDADEAAEPAATADAEEGNKDKEGPSKPMRMAPMAPRPAADSMGSSGSGGEFEDDFASADGRSVSQPAPKAEASAEKKRAAPSQTKSGAGANLLEVPEGMIESRRLSRRRAIPRRVRSSNVTGDLAAQSSLVENRRKRETAWQREPENRTLRMRYIRALVAAQDVDQARSATDDWLGLNPMDAEALVQMAQIELMHAKPENALEWLESGADAQPRGVWVHERLALAYEALGDDAQACSQRVLLGDLGKGRVTDVLACPLATDLGLFGLASDRLTKGEPAKKRVSSGDIKLTWKGDPGVTLVLVEPDGRALSWLSQRRSVQVSNVGTGADELGLPSAQNYGTYGVYVVSPKRAYGRLSVTTLGKTASFDVTTADRATKVANVSFSYKTLY
ncbi:MAG: VIT domain-containing protein [bacterium]